MDEDFVAELRAQLVKMNEHQEEARKAAMEALVLMDKYAKNNSSIRAMHKLSREVVQTRLGFDQAWSDYPKQKREEVAMIVHMQFPHLDKTLIWEHMSRYLCDVRRQKRKEEEEAAAAGGGATSTDAAPPTSPSPQEEEEPPFEGLTEKDLLAATANLSPHRLVIPGPPAQPLKPPKRKRARAKKPKSSE